MYNMQNTNISRTSTLVILSCVGHSGHWTECIVTMYFTPSCFSLCKTHKSRHSFLNSCDTSYWTYTVVQKKHTVHSAAYVISNLRTITVTLRISQISPEIDVRKCSKCTDFCWCLVQVRQWILFNSIYLLNNATGQVKSSSKWRAVQQGVTRTDGLNKEKTYNTKTQTTCNTYKKM